MTNGLVQHKTVEDLPVYSGLNTLFPESETGSPMLVMATMMMMMTIVTSVRHYGDKNAWLFTLGKVVGMS